MKRSPLKAKRDKPRRDEGRVTHKRMSIKPVGEAALERRHLGRVATLGCLVCGTNHVTVHHVTSSIHGGRIARTHQRVVPLCPTHHMIQFGPHVSVEALGHAGFYRAHGIDLLTVAHQLWCETLAIEEE